MNELEYIYNEAVAELVDIGYTDPENIILTTENTLRVGRLDHSLYTQQHGRLRILMVRHVNLIQCLKRVIIFETSLRTSYEFLPCKHQLPVRTLL